jgi:hypothetical protein
MSDKISEILERLERCESELQAARGYIKALEYGLHSLITTSSEPSKLSTLWRAVVKAHQEGDAPGDSKLHHLATRMAMDSITDHVEAAVRKRHN